MNVAVSFSSCSAAVAVSVPASFLVQESSDPHHSLPTGPHLKWALRVLPLSQLPFITSPLDLVLFFTLYSASLFSPLAALREDNLFLR